MILYTIMPQESVFPADENSYNQYESFYYKGVLVTAERTSTSRYRIVQISSTDPNDYLNSEFQPGSCIVASNFEFNQ
ncbi:MULTISPECIES: YlzJ-like family protein [Bacillus]|uniref:YlzJ-like family protein n=1 Tax=Bacillus TaxID=1386 RepID=UPI00035EBA46|nr:MULTISPECIES: YlzJ-like family protein [Bacillus]